MTDWISVKERLPEESHNVIVWLETGFAVGNFGHSIAYQLDGEWWGGIDPRSERTPHVDIYYADGGVSRMESNQITHWMPLPEPPSE